MLALRKMNAVMTRSAGWHVASSFALGLVVGTAAWSCERPFSFLTKSRPVDSQIRDPRRQKLISGPAPIRLGPRLFGNQSRLHLSFEVGVKSEEASRPA